MLLREAKEILKKNGYVLESRNYVLFSLANKEEKEKLEGIEDEDINYFAKKLSEEIEMPLRDAVGIIISNFASTGLLKQWKEGDIKESDLLDKAVTIAKKEQEKRLKESPQRWVDEVLEINPELESDIYDALYDYFDCTSDDAGMVYQRSVGRDSMVDSVFDYLDEISYDDLVDAFGTPEEFAKG